MRNTINYHMLQRVCVVSSVVAMTTFAGCKPKTPIAVPPSPPDVVVTTPIRRPVIEFEDFTGRTEATQSVEVRARVTGYLESMRFKEGADVHKGDLLFEIDRRIYQSEFDRQRAAVEQAKARLERLRLEDDRAKRLNKTRSVSVEEAERARYDFEEAQASLASAVAAERLSQLNLDFTRVISPIDGRISRRLVDVGNLIKADDTILTTIVTLHPMYAYFDIDERTLLRIRRLIQDGKIKSVREKEVTVQIGLADEEGFSLSGIVTFVDNRVDPNTGTLRLRAIVNNEKAFLSPGLFVRIRVPIGLPKDSLLIPEESLASDQGQKYVFVLNEKDEVQYRRVKLGIQSGIHRAIESGINLDDRVIVSGHQRVRRGIKVNPRLQPPEELSQGGGAAPTSNAPTTGEAKVPAPAQNVSVKPPVERAEKGIVPAKSAAVN